jgi:hypothetical protein
MEQTYEDLYKQLLEAPISSERFALPRRIDDILRSMYRRDPRANDQDDVNRRFYERIVSASQASLGRR